MFHAVYIADTNNNLVFEYPVNLSSPSFKSLTPILSQTAHKPDDLPLVDINSEYFLVFEKTKNLIIYVLCSNEGNPNPLMPLIFIQRLLEAMADYFGTPLALTKIDANNDTLTLLINEMLDDGVPNTTDFNKLRDLIPSKSFLSQLLSTSNELASSAAAHVTKSHLPNHSGVGGTKEPLNTIPWRRSNVKHTNNEMYVDLIETVNVILKPSKVTKTPLYSSNNHFDSAFYSSLKTTSQMVPISGHISGQINFNSHLTGVPLLQLLLSLNGVDLQLPSFHKCIEVEKWINNPGTLSFIPADGKSVLMNYEVDLDSAHSATDLLGLIRVDYQSGTGVAKNEFEVKLNIDNVKSVSKIEDLKVEIFCHHATPAANISSVKANRITHGDFTYRGNGLCEWNLRTVNTGTSPLLQGTIITAAMADDDSRESTPNLIQVAPAHPIRPAYVKLSFSYKGSVPSGLKVDSLKVISAKGMGDAVKPYKGVKYITRSGDYVIRS